jgi:hypothetical protein
MSLTPTANSATFDQQDPFIRTDEATIEELTLNAATRDSGATPTTQLRRGLVVGAAADGTYYDGASANVVANVAAVVLSSEAPGAGWQSATITAAIPGIGFAATVALGAADDTIAEVVAALNADAAFASHFVAADSGAADLVQITCLLTGHRILITSSLSTAFGASGTADSGTLTKHGVLREPIRSILGPDDTGRSVNASVVVRNCTVKESLLTGLTEDARRYFETVGIKLV